MKLRSMTTSAPAETASPSATSAPESPSPSRATHIAKHTTGHGFTDDAHASGPGPSAQR